MHDDVTTWLRGRRIELAEWRQPCNNSVHLANHVDQSTKVIIHGCESVEGLQCVDGWRVLGYEVLLFLYIPSRHCVLIQWAKQDQSQRRKSPVDLQ